jgi:hypothetical protein
LHLVDLNWPEYWMHNVDNQNQMEQLKWKYLIQTIKEMYVGRGLEGLFYEIGMSLN